ncbi:discoidin domain-containing protein [Paenibacillus thiaminolyticus]|uniref:discoidin domain-containing protein n=1 Tax=Paenibacillus thiaminolyticus TaxID=49283 RepID=UPI00254271A1|nr:discoidin domain-containing protein [Paenibacillus thiaminolyticus]WII36054.1 discoidin domain-containing protein [Paenibacillus thiaminolyticus]
MQRNFEVKALGDIWAEGERERRWINARKAFQPTGLYAKPNEQIKIEVSGDKPITAVIGVHRHDKEWAISYPLQAGINTISSPNGGLLSFDNSNNEGSIHVNVVSGGSPVPFFVLGKNTKADWQAMMSAYPDAPSVVLQSEKALLVFYYASAKYHILNQDPVSATDETRNKINSLSLPLLTAPIWFGSDYNIIKPTDGMDKVKGIIGVTANSQETSSANNAAVNAFDGDTNSIWHSEWNKPNQFPYNITAKYASPSTFSKLTYLPRQTGGENGIITNYKILTSLDGVTFNEIATGTWAKDNTEKTE